jgi:hypothetical protein
MRGYFPGLLTGLLLASILTGGANYVEDSSRGYYEPSCPPGYGPIFWGVLADSTTHPIYECVQGKSLGAGYSWEELENNATTEA